MLRLVWEIDARRDLREILDYIGFRNPDTAKRLGALIERTLD
jgi:plasmid stabilization system protein ParE